jgi:hypothetical protein
VSVVRCIAEQRATHRVPHIVTCATLGISISWFQKWIDREPTDRQRRRAALDATVRELFEASRRTYGSPRIHADLVETVSVNTVADSMCRQGVRGRPGCVRLDPRARGLVPAPLHSESPGTAGCGGPVPALLQQPTQTQLRRLDVADPIRETCCRPTGRSIREAFTLRGEAP